MIWEERLLFLMFLDYKGVLKKWEKNHNKCKEYLEKIDYIGFDVSEGFSWYSSNEGYFFWDNIATEWRELDIIDYSLYDYFGEGFK